MTTDPPPPGSPWARHCPDAYPAEWFDALGLAALPLGFARFATPEEVAVITGATAPDRPPGPAAGRCSPSAAAKPKPPAGKPEGRFAVLNAFVDAAVRELTRAELAVWLILYRDTKPDGTARTGQTDLARRAGCDERTVRRALGGLEGRGLVEVVTRGTLGSGASRYRVRGIAPG